MNDKNTPPTPENTTDEAQLAEMRAALEAVESRIAAACQQAGRERHEVTLLPVSKTVSVERMRLAWRLGLNYFGENKVQEAREKSEAMADLDIRWSVIGHLQTNKAKYVARFAHEFQALDSLKVAEELDRRLQDEGRSMDVLVQVNSSAEPSKYGLPPEEVPAFVRRLPDFSALKVKGLMTLALFSPDQQLVGRCFERMQTLQKQLRENLPDGLSMDELSMGMSGDFELAIAHGATIVRVGTAIFGSRAQPDSYYWPGIKQ
ncbi:MAG: YggS family pyridoxal phosphate-dependent enzyme [Gammaproteobacteria bacterium]|nr:YggS family pyridoxal phosphate-dependent enzyme [Gammaproteobacteria bacterium]